MSRVPDWPDRIIDELNANDRRATDIARGLGAEQLNWRPAEDSWSVGQCLQHLLNANDVYLPPMAAALDGARSSRVRDITPGWFGRYFLRTVIEPSPGGRRFRAPKKIVPREHVDADILERFLRSNDGARDFVRRAAAYDVNRLRFVNPFVPILRFTVGTGLEIVWLHQRRHLLQAERIKKAMLTRGPAT